MAHYRKIDIRIWLDQKFNSLSSDSQFVFLYLLTHPQLTALGAMRSTVPGLAAELDWPLERFEMAFKSLCEQGIVVFDQKACFVWAMNFLKYNPPESPNVVKSWSACLDYLPECDLKNQLIEKTQLFLASLPLSFQEALPDCFAGTTDSIVSCHVTSTDTMEKQPVTVNTNLRVPLHEDLPEVIAVPQVSHEALADTIAPTPKTFNAVSQAISINSVPESLPEGLPEGFRQAFSKTRPNHRTLNIKHRTLSIKQEQEQKENNLLLENNSEENGEIGEVTHIVAPARQKNSKPPSAEVMDVFRYWQQTLDHPHAVLDVKRRKCIHKALASGYSASQLCDAILGCSHTPHNMGNNEQGQRYDGLHVILRDADQIDRFIRNAHSPPRLQNAADKLMNTNEAARQRWLEKKRQEMEKVIHECS